MKGETPQALKDIADLIPEEMLANVRRGIDEILDQVVIIHHLRQMTGNYGDYWQAVVSVPPSDEQFYVSTGARQPSEAFAYLSENNLLPVKCVFKKSGRTYVVQSAK